MRLHPQGAPSVELSLCWACSSVYFLTAGSRTDVCTFDTSTPESKMLRAKFEMLFPEVEVRRLARPLKHVLAIPQDGIHGAKAGRLGGGRAAEGEVTYSIPHVLGLPDMDLMRGVIRQHLREVKSCYEATLTDNPDLQGFIQLDATIGPTGAVAAARVRHSSLADPPAEACIARAMQRWEFPKPKRGIAAVNVMFVIRQVQP